MIECLVKSDGASSDLPIEILQRAIRPRLQHTVGPGEWTIDVGGDRFVDFSPETAGLQITFEDSIERDLAVRVADEVAANLTSLTGRAFHVVWLS
jgi:hypothetical protein